VVSKKITKKAVERNMIKRRLRDIARELHKKLNNDFDIVISVKKPVLGSTFEEQKKILEMMFNKAKLLK
jgi:ribonuclease P protein component